MGEPILQKEYAMAVAWGNDSLLARINEGFRRIQQSGEYDRIYHRWFGVFDRDHGLSRALLETIMRIAPAGIGMVEDRVIVQVNEYICDVTGYTEKELLGQKADMLYPSPEESAYVGDEKYRQIAEKGTGSVETIWQHKDGSLRHVLLSSTPLAPGDLSRGVIFTVQDITPMKEAALEQQSLQENLVHRTILFLTGALIFAGILGVLILWLFQSLRRERKTAEELHQANLVVENSPAVVIKWKHAEGWPVLMVSRNIEQFGYSQKELLSGQVRHSDMVHPDDISVMDREIARNTEAYQDRYRQEYRLVTKDGDIRWIDDRTTVIRNDAGAVIGYEGILLDITDRKQAEQDLRENEQRLKQQNDAILRLMSRGTLFQSNFRKAVQQVTEVGATLLATERVSVWLYENEYSVIICSDLYEQKKGGHSSGETLPCKEFQTYTESHKKGNVIAVDDIFTDPRTKDSTVSYYHGNGITSLLDVPIYVRDRLAALLSFEHTGRHRVWTSEDERLATHMAALLSISFTEKERKETEEALRDSEARFKSIIAVSNTGAWEYHGETEKLWCSPEYFTMLGRVPQEEALAGEADLSTVWTELIHPEDRSRAFSNFSRYLAEGSPGMYEDYFRMIHRDGSIVWILSRGQTLRRDDGSCTDVTVGTHIDMTEKHQSDERQAELTRQLHQSNKMEAIGQLAGGVAHDFNNIIAGITGAAELLTETSELTQEQKECCEMILTAADRAGDVTRKLLLFSRKGNAEKTTLDCATSINDTISLLRHSVNKNITIIQENRAEKTTLVGDASMLQNAFMNIGINASHAMPEGGELHFLLENCILNREYCAISSFDLTPGEYLKISIRDTGCGMDSETMSRIFEPFFTTKKTGKGTGLGMSAVYGAVQKHGGAISVYSEVGTGSVFHIYLPVLSEIDPGIEQEEELPQGTGTILVIDDEELIRKTASALLGSLGYHVLTAKNGRDGVTLFEEKQKEIDLIILDMIMPVMGGRETFQKLRKIVPHIPIIVASGFAKEEYLGELEQDGVNGFLNKPFRTRDLAAMVAEHISPSTDSP